MLTDSHVHLQPHGERPPITIERIERYVEAGRANGVERIALTEHLFRFEEAYRLLHGWWDDDPDAQLGSLAKAYWNDHVSGTVADYVRVVEGLQEFGDLVELNISSPNTKLVYGWSTRPHELKDVFRAVRAATARPLIVKISPDFRDTNEEITIPAALDAGITIVNYGNTRRVEEPRLSQGVGGLSGPALFETTLENVRRVRARFGDRLELIATGGIDSPDKARAALAAGATACGIFTGFITRGPLLVRRILDALARDRP